MTWLEKLANSVFVRPRAIATSPAVQKLAIEPTDLREAAGVQRLAELGPANTSFVSAQALLGGDESLTLIRKACEAGETLWLVHPQSPAETADLNSRYPGTVSVLATETDKEAALLGLRPPRLLRSALATNSGAAAAFEGMDSAKLDRATVHALRDYGIRLHRDSWLRRGLNHPQFIVYIAVFVYSALRALPVSFVKEFHGSIFIFWALDLVTAVPYTWGVLAMLFGKHFWLRITGALTTIVTFVAPYVYFWTHGDGYPPYVPVVIGVLTLITVSSELIKYIQERNLERLYQRGEGASN